MFMKINKVMFMLVMIGLTSVAWAQQPGILDASFGTKGIQQVSFMQNSSNDSVTASVKDANGNLFITGIGNNSSQYTYLIKVLPTGKLDTKFGTAGKMVFNFGTSYVFYPSAVTLQSNGKIVAAGYMEMFGFEQYACVVKLNSDGSLDSHFGNSGSGTGYQIFGYNYTFNSVVVAPNGNIYASGSTGTQSSSSSDFFITAMDSTSAGINKGIASSGQITINFGSGDYITSSFLDGTTLYVAGTSQDQASGQYHYAYSAIDITALDTIVGMGTKILPIVGTGAIANTCTALQVTSDHSLVLGGYATQSTSTLNDFLIYKVTNTGGVNTSFTTTGYQTYPIGTSTDNRASAMSLDPTTNDILLAGVMAPAGIYTWGGIKIKSIGGSLDASFGSSGIQNFGVATGTIGIAGVSGDGSNGYYLIGTGEFTNQDITVKKITTSGSASTSYGTNSLAKFWLGNADGVINDLAVRSDGGFWVCGYANVSTYQYPAMALLKSDGTPDPSFGGQYGSDPGVIQFNAAFTKVPIFSQMPVNASAIELQPDGKVLVAGRYFDNGFMYLLRFNADGTLDTATFNPSTTPGYATIGSPVENAYVQDITVQSNGQILLSGYASQSTSPNMITIVRFNKDGSLDSTGFGTKGVFTQPSTDVTDYVMNKFQVKQQADNKIVCAGTSFVNNGSADFLVFRLTTAGVLDNTFGVNGNGIVTHDFGSDTADFAWTVVINPSNGNITTGGYTTDISSGSLKYALLQLTKDGLVDVTFGNSKSMPGTTIVDKGYGQQGLRDLYLDNTNTIVAAAMAGYQKGPFYMTNLRFTTTGALDPTYYSNLDGQTLSTGYSTNARIYNGALFIAGADARPVDTPPMHGIIAKVKLGTGPVIQTTNLKLNTINKTYGDAPFTLQPITNSSAPIVYTVTGYRASCINVDPSGLVTILCGAPGVEGSSIQIVASQVLVSGYTAASVSADVYISPTVPTIDFSDQGGQVGDTIILRAHSNSSSQINYYTTSTSNFTFISPDTIVVLGEGTIAVTASVNYDYVNYDYQSGSTTATIYGYVKLVPPDAFDDKVILTQGVNNQVVIDALANDAAYTGHLVPSSTDLDPATPGLQNTYVSPAIGSFYLDSLGNVVYTPFLGFIGTGQIEYTVTDSKGLTSKPAKITITVKQVGSIPALKATEMITPNNDGLNEAFVIGFVDFTKTNQLKIFDRNGEELYSVDNYKNDWSGTMSNGKQADSGVYYYLFVEGSDGDQRELKGAVQLQR
jgi:uncharacterized delta-60 repeat protein/gliding motility-associated-like protein